MEEKTWFIFTISDTELGIENHMVYTTFEDAETIMYDFATAIEEDSLDNCGEDYTKDTKEEFKVSCYSDGSMYAKVHYKRRIRQFEMKPVDILFPPIKIIDEDGCYDQMRSD